MKTKEVTLVLVSILVAVAKTKTKYALLKCMLILTNYRDRGAVIIDGWRSAMKVKPTMEEYNGSGVQWK